MEIIKQSDIITYTLIGEPYVYTNVIYRFMKYCLVADVDNGKLIYNGLTRSLVFILDSELDNINNINDYEYLYKNYFLVPENFDEQKIVDDLRIRLQKPIDDLYLERPQSFTVLTTTKCNARCFYCYEMNSKEKHHMSEEIANQVGDYISKVADRNKQISIQWFGGEPLFNMKVIDIIVNKVKASGQLFTTSFTTNGYLFDKDLVIKARNFWNTVSVQITLDGTESIYNKTKNYIYTNNINPYKKVLNNIATLLNYDIQVTIRLNLDFHNAGNLKELAKEIYNRFGLHPNLSIYIWPVFEDSNNIKTKEEHESIFQLLKEVEETFESYGYFMGIIPKSTISYSQCMADDGKSVTISPDGDLGTCEHLIDSHFWGNIKELQNKNFDNLNIWREYEKPLDICNDCPLYPSCIRPSMCKEMSKCDLCYKEWRIRKQVKGIMKMYKDTRRIMLNDNI